MNKLIVANIKMNKSVLDMRDYLSDLNQLGNPENLVILTPLPFLFLGQIYDKLSYGVQNFFYKDDGAFTGEVNFKMIKDFNVKYALIGHSERRKNFKESNAVINKKLLKCIEENITPILCIGESLGQSKTQNLTKAHFKRQLNLALKNVRISDLNKIIIAYEPTYAINADEPLDLVSVESNVNLIKELVQAKSTRNEISIKVLYGGSINRENYKKYLSCDAIDGLLVGRASLNSNTVSEMLNEE